jgi:hypothetical protein
MAERNEHGPQRSPGAPVPDPHDDREIEVKGLLRLGVILALVTAGAVGMMWILTAMLQREERSGHRELPPIAVGRSDTPPEPRLQPRPPEGLAELRAQEDEVLERYRWVDPARGVVSIPIQRAIELLSERPPPSRDPAQAPDDPRSSRPTQSTLDGRPRGAR